MNQWNNTKYDIVLTESIEFIEPSMNDFVTNLRTLYTKKLKNLKSGKAENCMSLKGTVA